MTARRQLRELARGPFGAWERRDQPVDHPARPTLCPDEFWLPACYLNNRYSVQHSIYVCAWGEVDHLWVRRHDGDVVRSWADLQRIKDELLGRDRVAVEVFPPRRARGRPGQHVPPVGAAGRVRLAVHAGSTAVRRAPGHHRGCVCSACWPSSLRATLLTGAIKLVDELLRAPPAATPARSRRRRRGSVQVPRRSATREQQAAAIPESPPPLTEPLVSPREPRLPRPRGAVPVTSAPPAAAEDTPRSGTSVSCRVCGVDDQAERIHPDLHVSCIDEALRRAKRKERVLVRRRELTREQLVARLARDRGGGEPAIETDAEPPGLTADEAAAVEAATRGELATGGLGGASGWNTEVLDDA